MELIKTKFLMWTDIEIILNNDSKNKQELEYDIEKAFDIFSKFEKEFSRFDEKSGLSKLNKNRTLQVSDNFIEVLKLSKEIYKITNWYFNPLVNVSSIWYNKSFEKICLSQPFPPREKGESRFKSTNIFFLYKNFIDKFSPIPEEEKKGKLNLEQIQIIWNKVILNKDQNLDLGWIVKWWTADKVKDFLKNKWYKDFIVNAGWDIVVWEVKSTIAINSPFNKEDIFALLDLQNCSISTSGTYKRKWEINWKKFNHILNPKNNKNNNEIVSISIIWEKCYITDSLATACIAMWLEKTKDFLENQELDAIIILENWDYEIVWDLKKYNFEKI